jgi:hypothetical protein
MGLITGILVAAALAPSLAATRASVSELDHELHRELHRGPQRPMVPPAQPTAETLACYERLTKIAHFVSVATPTEPPKCAVNGLVRLEHVRMSDQTKVAIIPPATLRCGMAEAFAQWIREDLGYRPGRLLDIQCCGKRARSWTVMSNDACRVGGIFRMTAWSATQPSSFAYMRH